MENDSPFAQTNHSVDPQTVFAALRDALAELYLENQDANRVVHDARLDARRIAFNSRALTNWHNILAEAICQDCLASLLNIALSDYSRNTELLAAYKQYQLLIGQGSHLEAPTQLIDGNSITITEEQAYNVYGLLNPYLGLRSFTYDDRGIYAGREQLAQETVRRLTTLRSYKRISAR